MASCAMASGLVAPNRCPTGRTWPTASAWMNTRGGKGFRSWWKGWATEPSSAAVSVRSLLAERSVGIDRRALRRQQHIHGPLDASQGACRERLLIGDPRLRQQQALAQGRRQGVLPLLRRVLEGTQ